MISMNFKPIVSVEITIKQKGSNTHTKFTIVKGCENPFPEENFLLAKAWMEQGLLEDGAFGVMKKLSKTNGRADEIAFTF